MRKALVGLGTVGLVMVALWYSTSQKIDTHRAKATEELNRDISELKADTAKTKADREKYQARANEAGGKIKAMEAEEAEQKAKDKKTGADIDAAMKEMEKEDQAKKK